MTHLRISRAEHLEKQNSSSESHRTKPGKELLAELFSRLSSGRFLVISTIVTLFGFQQRQLSLFAPQLEIYLNPF